MNPLMKLRKRPQLALLFSALLVLFCRGPQSDASWLGPGCTVYVNYLENGSLVGKHDQYNCPITCPDGSSVIGEGREGDKYADLQADGWKKCSAPAATATPTASATPQDTSTPTATATPQQLLSGDVKACSLVDRYINFALNPNLTDTKDAKFEVTIGGEPVTCTVPSSNREVLSCNLPQGQTFPAEVIIHVDGQLTDTFTYDGSGCIQRAPTKDDPPQDPDTGLPLCTGVPPYPEGCTPP